MNTRMAEIGLGVSVGASATVPWLETVNSVLTTVSLVVAIVSGLAAAWYYWSNRGN